MRKVITVALNDTAYQIAEDGYEALRDYLDAASRRLAANPDRAEVLADLEQSIGDKCAAVLGSHKNVVAGDEIRQILRAIGPVEPGDGRDAAGQRAASGAGASASPGTGASDEGWSAAAPVPPPRRRLSRIPSEGLLGGVCAGLAAYFALDVVWIRVAFVLLAVTTGGVWLLVWLTLLFVMPRAATPAEIAEAHGEPRGGLDGSKKKREGRSARVIGTNPA
jgi:phage shock protein C